MSASQVFTLFLFLCFVLIRTSLADRSLAKTLQSQERYKNTQIYFDYESEKNGTLFYMLCHGSSQNMPFTIFKEEHYVDKLPRISLCNVTLEVEDPYVRIGEPVRILPLNPSKALILWVGIGAEGSRPYGLGAVSSLRYTIVDFDTCRTAETTMTTDYGPPRNNLNEIYYPVGEFIVKSAGFALYHNSCDIAFHDWRCDLSFCKLRIDRNTGKVVNSKVDFWYKLGPEISDILPKNPRNPDEGNFFVDWKGGEIYKYEEGQGLILFPNKTYHENWQKFRYSVRDYYVTVCSETEETKVKCDQIDYTGVIVMHAIFDLQKKNLAPVPYTLRGGGFLLLTTECVSNCTERATNHVYNVDISGKINKLIDIEGFNCNVNEFTHWHKFFEHEQGKLCVSLLCYRSKRSQNGYTKTIVPNFNFHYAYFNAPEELHVQCLKMFNV